MENDDYGHDQAPDDDALVYWIPIEGLSIDARWSIGAVTMCPTSDALGRLPEAQPAGLGERFAESLSELKAGAVAEVVAADANEAIDLVGQAIDLLRVFQHVRHFTTHLTQFGLPET